MNMKHGKIKNEEMQMKKYTLLSENLRQIRRAREITQKKAAEMLGVSLTTFIYWEKGKVKPTADNLIKLVNLFGNEIYKEESIK